MQDATDTDELSSPYLLLRIVYTDVHLIEMESRLVCGDWAGVGCSYTQPEPLKDFAGRLLEWSASFEGECTLTTGADTGIGFLQLRFYTIDLAGHAMCHITISTMGSTGCRPEEIRRLSLEVPTEPGLIERFARQLTAMADDASNSALLQGVSGS